MDSYITIFGKVESYEDASYEVERKVKQADGSVAKRKEIVTRFKLSLQIPGMRELMKVYFSEDTAPGEQNMQGWEDNDTWVKVSAENMNSGVFQADDKAVGFANFTGISCIAASQSEMSELNKARRAQKAKAKARREEAKKRAKATAA
jgi:hypothetical protein